MTEFRYKGRGVVQITGRQMGKSMSMIGGIARAMANKQRPKVIWEHLPGRKLKATWSPEQGPGPRGYEMYGFREEDMDPIQQWCQSSNCGKRISFDMFQFKNDKQITMFLLRWSS
jgi:hypothetical protein